MSETPCDPLFDKREKLIMRLMPYVQKHGFSPLKMDDAAKCMDISKATMYKYFASKDEIAECIIVKFARFVSNQMLSEAPPTLSKEPLSRPSAEELKFYNESFAQAFKLTIKLSFYLTDVLLLDLKVSYPDLSSKLEQAVELCKDKLADYFNSGIQLGVFYPMNTRIYLTQVDLVLRKLWDPTWLMLQNLTMKQALMDFYKTMKHQVFYEKWMVEDDSAIGLYFDKLIMGMRS
ncbi:MULTISPECIES: TetR/AcrR family transcriptional regulator [unclassified Paenibacillus]|uniref:TetR/AcrR family transcriptional regulator n=1 Tax=unclassified Paenibacillus TaxID=185978 RepID=UPI000954896D|nr:MULTISPECIES: TetR/AcrR family transcriptional regulator [unclassified Paenibacillus]ASS68416.1 TetR/AcrR family transcriptional regulator [Paenibacillus sp. RUD330]SIR32424.1 transcriptional regulator, TetR family [Paenibacillus sp. RU4X]SIR43719.1 transcriptional regulator, TetR family [Paenibacillus sp. RU4T]